MSPFVDPYCYPDSDCLRNKLDIHDPKELDRAERFLVHDRTRQGVPVGNFDLAHLRAIHKHLFQDVYEWAGEVRTINISKGDTKFASTAEIPSGMVVLQKRLAANSFLRGMNKTDFSHHASHIIGQVNYLHPFREGNGRTQLQYLKQLAENAGHKLDLTKFRGKKWIEASRESHHERYEPMRKIIRGALVEPKKDREQERQAALQRLLEIQQRGRGR